MWIFQIEGWHRRERGKAAGEVWKNAAAEETKVGGTTVEETKENCAGKSEQKKRKDGKKSSKESCQECKKKKNTSCLQKYAMRGFILFFRLTKTLKERESWFEKQLQKKIGNYSKRSKFFRMSAVYFLGILVLICTFVQILRICQG